MKRFLFFFLFCVVTWVSARGQFALDMGGQGRQQNDTISAPAQEAFKPIKYLHALTGKDSLSIFRMWTGTLIPGYGQAYNRQYWKIPVIYAGIGSMAYFGYKSNKLWHSTGNEQYATYRNLFYIGAGLVYWGSMIDALVVYPSHVPLLPARSTLLSALLPGLGQAYNGDYWKIPIIYGGLITCGYFLNYNQSQYMRFKKMHNRATASPSQYDGWMTPSNLEWYRDTYRRYRDYSVLATVLVYALNILDANVFAHLSDFDVSDNLALHLSPTVFTPLTEQYAQCSPVQGVGLQMRLHF